VSDIVRSQPVTVDRVTKLLMTYSLMDFKYKPKIHGMDPESVKGYMAGWVSLLRSAGVENPDLAPAFEKWAHQNQEWPTVSDIVKLALEIGVERRAQATRKPTCVPFEGEAPLGANAERFQGMTPEQMRADLRKRLEVEA
jgi:hypothetical protein